MEKTHSFGIRLHESVLEQLQAEADKRGIARAALVRQFIDAQLHELRRDDLRAMRRASTKLARQARAIFKNLPAGEIEDQDPLHFTMEEGNILIHDDLTGHEYKLFEDVAVRLRLLGDRVELTFWEDGKQIDQQMVPLEEHHDKKC